MTKKTHSFPCVLFAFDFIICLYFLAKLSQLTWFCIIYWKATLRGGEVICTLMGHTGGYSICLNVAELSQPMRRSWVNLSMASATVQTPSLQWPSYNPLKSRMGLTMCTLMGCGLCWMEFIHIYSATLNTLEERLHRFWIKLLEIWFGELLYVPSNTSMRFSLCKSKLLNACYV